MSDELEEYKGSQAEISEIIYSEKTKKIIEERVLINYLNSRLESTHI